MVRKLILFAVTMFEAFPSYAVVNQAASSIDLQLDHVSIRVGNQVSMVQNGETLPVLRGERIRIEKASLVGNRLKPDRVDLVGYAVSKDVKDDRNRWIDTNRDLLARFAVANQADHYAVKVYRGSKECGQIFVQLVEPSLNYATVKVNGESKVIRASDTLVVKDSDQFKVDKVVTNFGEDKDVTVRFEPIEVRGKGVDFKMYEMQLVRKNVVFAKINLQVRGQ